MDLIKKNDSVWLAIGPNGAIGAEFHLDFRAQMARLLLLTPDPSEQRACKELAASHVSNYLIERRQSCFGGIMINTVRGNGQTKADSDRYMSFAKVGLSIKQLSDEVLDAALKPHVEVMVAEFNNPVTAIATIVQDVERVTGRKIKVSGSPEHVGLYRHDCVYLVFSLEVGGGQFRFWNSVGSAEEYKGRSPSSFYIIPGYHPEARAAHRVALINGDTDAVIQGDKSALGSVESPPESRTTDEHFGTTWSHMKHPYYAAGSSIVLQVDLPKVTTKAGSDGLRSFLLAALEHDNMFVGVSGGWRADLEYSPNIIRRRMQNGLTIPYKEVRGSEGDCVWQYRTLEQEGKLADAHVPEWFMKEGWLELYK